jgi:hypothetical protein
MTNSPAKWVVICIKVKLHLEQIGVISGCILGDQDEIPPVGDVTGTISTYTVGLVQSLVAAGDLEVGLDLGRIDHFIHLAGGLRYARRGVDGRAGQEVVIDDAVTVVVDGERFVKGGVISGGVRTGR